MTRPIDEILSRLLDLIRATWPLLYVVLIVGFVHYCAQKLKARQLQRLEPPRPVIFDEKLKRFRRFETADQFLSVEEFAEPNDVQERREDDSGHASFSTESSLKVTIEELATSQIYEDINLFGQVLTNFKINRQGF
jgi:hypothetical protein